MSRNLRWLLPFAVLPLLGLPIVAQENEPSPAEPAPAAAEIADDDEDELDLPLGPDERVSADNNLSFPVDI